MDLGNEQQADRGIARRIERLARRLEAAVAAGLPHRGTIATVLTHPSDTIKTRQQAFPDLKTHPQYRTMLSTTRYVIGDGGVGALFAGLLPRAFRIIGAMFIFNEIKTRAVDHLESR